MHRSLDFPLTEGFFPQIVLNTDEIKYYKRLGKERVGQLIRIIEDADCAYKWADTRTKLGDHCQRAQFLDFRPSTKATYASMLLKSSVLVADTRPEEVLQAIAKVTTKDFRKTMAYLHGSSFVDGRTLFTFPSSRATYRPGYAYRAIKWHAIKSKQRREDQNALDFCYLEYSGKKKPMPGTSVVGFCVQESISREREVPTLENFGVSRGYMSRTGIIISKTHHAHMLRITSICQIDGDLNPLVRNKLEELMQEQVCAVSRIKGLLDRQRVSSLRFVEQWQWVPNSDRKACAVCLRGFYFHRKHHCRTCGEVVCSSCAPHRELEEPIFDITHLRVCSVCMISAATANVQELQGATESGQNGESTSNGDTESYIRGLRSPQHNSYEDMIFQMRESKDQERRSSEATAILLEKANNNNKDKRSTLRPQEKMQALTNVVNHIREIRDTINCSISEVDFQSLQEGEEDEEEINEMFNQMNKIRTTLETSVTNFDAALANATGTPLYVKGMHQSQHEKPVKKDKENTDNKDNDNQRLDAEEDDIITQEQFESVARITFAAARATKQAGQAFISSYSDNGHRSDQEHDEVASFVTGYSDASHDPYSSSNYERVMASYQPETDESTSSAMDENDSHHLHQNGLKRTLSSSSVFKTNEIVRLQRKIEELQRSLETAQRKLSMFEDVDDMGQHPEAERPSARLAVVQEESAQAEIESVFEIFGQREGSLHKPPLPSSSSAGGKPPTPATSPVTSEKAMNTLDLVSELRGVMNSSEVTKPTTRRSFSKPPSPALDIDPPMKERTSSPGIVKSMFIDPSGRLVPRSSSPASSSGAEKTKKEGVLDRTASSTSTIPPSESVGGLQSSSSRGILVGERTHADSDLDTATYQQLMDENNIFDDDAYDSSSDDDDGLDNVDNDISIVSLSDKYSFGPHDNDYRPQNEFFLEAEVPVKKYQAMSPQDSEHLPVTGCDESEELRALMEDLTRPRSNSMPFQSSQQGGTSSEEQYEKPTWSDGVPERSITNAHHVTEAVREIRACLSSFRCECPSEYERQRKLGSIFKVLRSLHREGVRSKFRTLNHEDIRYTKVLKETPSIIKLLKLAGYVSLPQKLTMRRVDQEYLALFLREIQDELND